MAINASIAFPHNASELSNTSKWTDGNNWDIIPVTDASGITHVGLNIDFHNADSKTIATDAYDFRIASGADNSSLVFHNDAGTSVLEVTNTGDLVLPGLVDGRSVSDDGAKLDGIEALADVTDATNVAAAGAVMESDATTAAMTFVIDEDNMASDLDTKVPTQQSVKAYVDAEVAGALTSEMSYKGSYDAATNTPNLDDVGAVATSTGDTYTVTVAGTFFTTAVESGDMIIAEQAGATSEANWTIVNKNLDAGSIKTAYESNANTNEFSDAEQTKLAGIETGATADQTAAEIKFAYESNTDTNEFSDAEQTKLAGIETLATADQTAAEIKSLYEGEANAFTDAQFTKLAGIETAATADQTAAEIKSLYESNVDTNEFSDAEQTKLFNIETLATADQTAAEIKSLYEGEANAFTDAQFTKLAGIESGATADQSNLEIKTAYEANADTNEFSDAEQTKLAGIEAGATADQTDAQIKTAYEANANTNEFSDAEKTKLGTVESNADVTDSVNVNAAGAVMVSDSSTSGMGFVVDEDTMGSDSATKVPTQQSVKAYVDAEVAGAVASEMSYKGGYNAATNTPDIDTAPTGVAIGDMYTVTAAGTFFTTAVEIGDMLIAEVANATLESQWTIVNKNLDAGSIKTAYESNANTNEFSDAEQTKLAGIETGATADQTGAQIKSLYQAQANAFTDAQFTKLAGIETGATADQTAAEIKSLYESNANTNEFSDAEQTKLAGIASGATNVTNNNQLINGAGYTTAVGDITNVTAGTGLAGGGTSGSVSLSLNFAELTDMTGNISGTTEFIVQNGTTESRKAASEIQLSNFSNNLGWTSSVGDITNVTAGTGLSGGGTSGSVSLGLDFAELAVGGTLVGTDYLISENGGVENRQLISSIPLSIFSNNAGWTNDQTPAEILAALKTVDVNGTGGVNAGTFDGLTSGSFLRSDATDSFTTLQGSRIDVGSVKLTEATHRAELLRIASPTTSWSGIQVGNDTEDLWNFMADGNSAGIYNDTTNGWHVQCVDNGQVSIYYNELIKFATTSTGITVTGVVNATSDERLKDNIVSYEDKGAAGIRAVDFNWKDAAIGAELVTGYIAQEVETILPEAVREDEEGIKSVNYDMVHTAKIAELEAESASLKQEVADLKELVNKLLEAK